MTTFCPLFSSSKGNCIYIGAPDGGILIDAGKSCRQIETALHNIGVAPDSIRAVFVTHEHTDHISGLRVLASKYGTRVYASGGTLEALDDMQILNGKFDAYALNSQGTEVGSLFIKPFRTSHDARESCGYVISAESGERVAVATDLGIMTETVRAAITGCETVLLESNHDVRMLENNPQYPYPLKKRILGERGHLCNEVCAETACELVKNGTKHLFLGHLSEQNNLPALAYRVTASELVAAGAVENADFDLRVAKPVWDERAVRL
ncbi:MAG: MBL fold metallo-hydrolase [Candidatus Fimenecus sp.]